MTDYPHTDTLKLLNYKKNIMTCCPEIKRGYLRHIKWTMFEVPENYKSIIWVYTKAWTQITEFTKLLPRTIDFWCTIPQELLCLEVAYIMEDNLCQDCNCCN